MDRGWVYIISNPAMPGLIKVGYSTRHPKERAKELKTTGIPTEYEVVFSVIVDGPRKLEQKIHRHLKNHQKGGEWFTCSSTMVTAAIKELYTGAYYTEADYKNISTADIAKENEKLKLLDEEKAAEEVAAAFVEKNRSAALVNMKITAKYRNEIKASERPFLDILSTNTKLNGLIRRQWQEIEALIAPIYGNIYFVCEDCGHKGLYKPTWQDAGRGTLLMFDCPQCKKHISKISFTGWNTPPFFRASLYEFSTKPSSW